MWIELCKPKNIKEYESFEWSGSIKIRVQVFPTYLDITARDLVLLQASLIIDFTEECCTKSFDDKKNCPPMLWTPTNFPLWVAIFLQLCPFLADLAVMHCSMQVIVIVIVTQLTIFNSIIHDLLPVVSMIMKIFFDL